MENLVYLSSNGATTNSLLVAEHFHKRHTDVLRKIETLIITDSTQNCVRCFKETKYEDSQGSCRRMYSMNRDGFAFLVMGFTGDKANQWKWDFIKAFNMMESRFQEKMLPEWSEARSQSKITRRAETDMIKKLVDYAKNNGSKHADRYYVIFTKLANKFAQIGNRDEASIQQLNNLSLGEHIILHVIEEGLIEGKDYHDIYKDCKERLDTVSDLAFITNIDRDKLTTKET